MIVFPDWKLSLQQPITKRVYFADTMVRSTIEEKTNETIIKAYEGTFSLKNLSYWLCKVFYKWVLKPKGKEW